MKLILTTFPLHKIPHVRVNPSINLKLISRVFQDSKSNLYVTDHGT